jgi:prepilin-type N-terminal cleavage/methylation domain-containing protein
VKSGAHHGFTLIEVLLVFVLLALVTALVVPLGVAQVEKARAQAEWLEFARLVDRIGMDAFLRSETVSIDAAGTELRWRGEAEAGSRRTFDYLFFEPAQQVRINPNGIADREEIVALVRDQRRTLSLLPEGAEY